MHNQIKGLKEVFLPPYPKESSQEMVNYLREIERNLRELSRRTYTDTESSFTDLGGLQGDLVSGLERIGYVEADIIDLDSVVDGLTSQINGINSQINGINSQLVGISNNVDILESNLDSMSTQVSSLTSDLSNLQNTINSLSIRISALENQVGDGGTVRPVTPYLYQVFFDSNLGQPIWWSGEDWVDSEGNIV